MTGLIPEPSRYCFGMSHDTMQSLSKWTSHQWPEDWAELISTQGVKPFPQQSMQAAQDQACIRTEEHAFTDVEKLAEIFYAICRT